MPTFGSLFAGIGGMDLGLERAGWKCRWQVEWDAWCRDVLAAHWPDVRRYGDVTQLSGHELEPVDLMAGGFPCQGNSQAGNRKGTEDERWLWPEFARLVRLLRPRLVLVENVAGLRTVNRGAAFNEVLSDLAAIGYDAEWDGIPAASVGAPHLRDRLFLVAYPDSQRPVHWQPRLEPTERRQQALRNAGASSDEGQLSVPDGNGERPQGSRLSTGEERQAIPHAYGSGPRVFRQASRPSGEWVPEPRVGRVVDGIPSRLDKHRIKGIGNAVVPAVAEWIGRRLMEVA